MHTVTIYSENYNDLQLVVQLAERLRMQYDSDDSKTEKNPSNTGVSADIISDFYKLNGKMEKETVNESFVDWENQIRNRTQEVPFLF